jgi:hypothetical protein
MAWCFSDGQQRTDAINTWILLLGKAHLGKVEEAEVTEQ